MDAFILLVIIVFLMCWYRKFSKVVYGIAMIDIFLRIVDFLTHNLYIRELSDFANKYLPKSIHSVINNYLEGIPAIILVWAYVIIMCVFLFYTARIFIKKR